MVRLNLNKSVSGYPKKRDIIDAINCLPGFDPCLDTGGAEFDWRVAADWVYLWEHTITHIEGPLAGEFYKLEPHEKGILANITGWIMPATDTTKERRRFRDVLYYVPQGNSKTTFAAGLVTLFTGFDREPGAQNVSTASTRDQANMLKRVVSGMIENNPALATKFQVQQNSVTIEDRFYKTTSAEAGAAHGFNLYLTVNDECHAHKSPDFLDVIRKKGQKRPDSLRVYITTADFIRESVCNTMYERAKKVLQGEISVPSMLPAVFEVTQEQMEADPLCWKEPAMWKQANPLLGKAISYENFEQMVQEAEESLALQNEFLRLCLNIRTQSKSQLIKMDNWINKCGGKLNIDDYKGKTPAGVGLDLGQTSDFTVMCVLYDLIDSDPDEHEYAAFWYHWTPMETARDRQISGSGANYEAWAREKWMTLTDGDETDWNGIKRGISELCPELGVNKMAIDRLFQGHQLSQDIANDGVEVVDFGQGFQSMAAPTLEFIKCINSGRIKHGDNPCMLWQAGNVMGKQDAAGNIKPDKAKSGDKIDGIVAAIMALGMAMAREEPPESLLEKYGGILYV